MTNDLRVKAPWHPERCQVVANEPGGADWHKLTLRSPALSHAAKAGQFVQVSVRADGQGNDPLLNRPLSICELRPDEGLFAVIYRAGGRGTRTLARVRPGQVLTCLGPLGFSFPDPARGSGTLVLVGGGVGIPPMAAAAAWARAAGRPVLAVVGARTADGLAGLEELQATGALVTVCTDDGSRGIHGLVAEPLEGLLQAGGAHEVWACGPEPMLRAVKVLSVRYAVPAWVSLERYMACGFGVCMSCTVEREGGEGYGKYMRCCTDGPVFPAEAVKL